jgi:hypothetical protein
MTATMEMEMDARPPVYLSLVGTVRVLLQFVRAFVLMESM